MSDENVFLEVGPEGAPERAVLAGEGFLARVQVEVSPEVALVRGTVGAQIALLPRWFGGIWWRGVSGGGPRALVQVGREEVRSSHLQ